MIRTSESVAAISAAWVAAAGEMPNVPRQTKGQVGTAIRYYADLATVTETVRPILFKNGLAYLQGVSDGDKVVTVTTRLLHTSGEWMEDSLTIPTGQNTAQAIGSACSYARRYSLMAVLGLAPDDDDGAAASKPAPRAAPRATREEAPPVAPRYEDAHASDDQVQKIQILMRDVGGRDAKLSALADLVLHPVTTSKALTRAEASRVIDYYEQRS